ncbi:MAG: Asp-tRNA(Asn)/Glu-tRNA(Gln) amidotransferase subunit GatC [bacterium]
MDLTKKQAKEVAGLARLELTDKETRKFQKDLSAVLDFVDKLNEAKIGKVDPTAHIAGLENVMREDEGIETDKKVREKLLNLAPDKEGDQVKVKSVL